jgi:hypothetical protein
MENELKYKRTGTKGGWKTEKTCGDCAEALTEDNWTPSCMKANRHICKCCWVIRQNAYATNNPNYKEERRERNKKWRDGWSEERKALEESKRKDRYFKRKYGIGLEEYETMFAAQCGLCKICKTDEKRGIGDLQVDHCHTTGEIRGLLCSNCNLMLGLVYDDTETLLSAIEYLSLPIREDHKIENRMTENGKKA